MSDRAHTVAAGLATTIWQACLQDGHPIGVPASRVAAEAAVDVLGVRPVDRRPLMAWAIEQLGVHDRPPALLAADMRRVADALEARAHDECVSDALTSPLRAPAMSSRHTP